jgi:DNA-binding ferritin-like protein (Dps family)
VEEQRAEDLEIMKLDLEAMLEEVIEDLTDHQKGNTAEFKLLLQEMKSQCSEQQVEIVNKLVELERNDSANQKVTSGDITRGLHARVQEDVASFMNSLKNELDAFRDAMKKTRETIALLKEDCDVFHTEMISEIERKFNAFQSVSVREVQSLKEMMDESKVELIHTLQAQFASLNLLSIRRDIKDVKSLLQELKESQSGSDARVQASLNQFEDKVASSTMITKQELLELKQWFGASHDETLNFLESKLDALNLVSLEQAMTELKDDVKIHFQDDNTLMNGMNELKSDKEELVAIKLRFEAVQEELLKEREYKMKLEEIINNLQQLLEFEQAKNRQLQELLSKNEITKQMSNQQCEEEKASIVSSTQLAGKRLLYFSHYIIYIAVSCVLTLDLFFFRITVGCCEGLSSQ